MLFLNFTKYTDVIVYGYDSRLPFCDLIHSHFKNVLGHFQTKGHSQKSISTFVGVEGS